MEQLTRENYYEYGDADNLVVSNSMLSKINPQQGGSPACLRRYLLEEEEQKYKFHLEKGHLFHSYMENPEGFSIYSGVRPSPAVVELLNVAHDKAKTLSNEDPGDIEQWNDILLKTAREKQWNPNYKDETITKKLKESWDYWEFLNDSQDKYILTEAEKEALSNMIEAVQDSDYYTELMSSVVQHEIPMLGTYKVAIPGIPSGEITVKCLIDRFSSSSSKNFVDEIKTTSEPCSSFMGYRRAGFNFEGLPILKWLDGPFHRFRYYRQLAYYNMIVRQNFEGPVQNRIYVVETVPPYEIERYDIDMSQWETFAALEIAVCMQEIGRYIQQYNVGGF